jgi:transcriptional regulator with XRE-family HTH domain
MSNFSSRWRAGTQLIAGRRRANILAQRLAVALRGARLDAGLKQSVVAALTQISQPEVSRLERGQGQTASIETWASLAAACGRQLAAFLEEMPGATRPRDYEHLKRQQLVADLAATGGWRPEFEHGIDPAREQSRSIDLQLDRYRLRETAVVEIWDWFDDVGAGFRGLDSKVNAARRELAARELAGAPPWRVSGLMVVRATRRNRQLVGEFKTVFRSRYPAPGHAWLTALRSDRVSMPGTPGFLWTDVGGTRLFAARW